GLVDRDLDLGNVDLEDRLFQEHVHAGEGAARQLVQGGHPLGPGGVDVAKAHSGSGAEREGAGDEDTAETGTAEADTGEAAEERGVLGDGRTHDDLAIEARR